MSLIKEVVRLTNVEREKAGLQPLKLNNQLVDAAQDHSNDMAQDDFFSHTGADGSSASDRVKASGYQYSTTGENIAAGQKSAEEVVRGWMNSPGHRANILNGNYTEIGVGYEYLQNDTGSVNYNHYWTQVFGTPLNNNRGGSTLESPSQLPPKVEETSDISGLENMTGNKPASPKAGYEDSLTGKSSDSILTGGDSGAMPQNSSVEQYRANFMELLDNSSWLGSSANVQENSESVDFAEYISQSDLAEGKKNMFYELLDSFM